MKKSLKIIFICTSNADRSPSLEKYFKEIHPNNEYRSAGINKYFCEKKGTHLINKDDIIWADLLVFAEDVHFKVVCERYSGRETTSRTHIDFYFGDEIKRREFKVLNCGEYTQGCIGEDYLTKAEMVLSRILK